LAATSALDSMIWSIRVASCCTDAAKMSRPTPHHKIAPILKKGVAAKAGIHLSTAPATAQCVPACAGTQATN